VTDNSILVVSIIAIAILAAIVLTGIRRGTGSGDKSNELQKLRRSGSFWGVRIQPGKCNAIRPFAGRRFTFEEAPNLPLPGCNAWRCSCTYIGVPERRREERRIHNDRRDVVRIDEEHVERRSFRGRRRGHKARNDPAD
jgi:hypothetical protein